MNNETVKQKLIHGNCFTEMKKMANDSFDVVFTSPPYNRKRNDKYNNHTDIVDNYYQFLHDSVSDCLRVCGGNVFYNIQKNSYNRADVHKLMGAFASELIEVIIWHKSNPMPNPHVINAYEYILVFSSSNNSLKANKTYTKNHFTTPVYSSNPYKKIHRAVMNPDACSYVLRSFASAGDTVLDPFMGVGTTGAVCSTLGMNFTGIEQGEEYYECCKKRLCGESQMEL
jgi:DNA modification methylase